MNFSESDLKQILQKGLTVEEVEKQLHVFANGIPFVDLFDAATIGNGILKLSDEKRETFVNYFEEKKNTIELVKFVPASGAATRMFKFLFKFLEDYSNGEASKLNENLQIFSQNLKHFPFYKNVLEKVTVFFPDYDGVSKDEQLFYFVRTMLDTDKLNLSAKPKGLLPFHVYENQVVTAFEEHLNEAALYASSKGKAALHFTVSNEHIEEFQETFKQKSHGIEIEKSIKLNVNYSTQKESTDTIAVNPDNSPFRNAKGNLLFRPSGHGALLSNLNSVSADIIFIKNIDNVVVSKYSDDIAYNKKLLGGILLQVQNKVFKYLQLLENTLIPECIISDIITFLTERLNIIMPSDFEAYSTKDKIDFYIQKLNRPIRVCGMVKNEGEPGGGPFWVKDEYGTISLQIVESAQIDLENAVQKEIFQQATHFNPVDLVCGTKNYKGEPFNLFEFVDHKAAFISTKTQMGKPLKALELPGLWNGSMAYWNTIFVEVSLITFNPVKTVNDLLKPAHKSS